MHRIRRSGTGFGVVAGGQIGLDNTLKVETRVQIPLGLQTQTCRSRAKSEGQTRPRARDLLAADPANIPRQLSNLHRHRRSGDARPCLSLHVSSRPTDWMHLRSHVSTCTGGDTPPQSLILGRWIGLSFVGDLVGAL